MQGEAPLPDPAVRALAPSAVQRAVGETLARDGITRLYEGHHERRDLTFVSRERVILAHYYEEALPRYARAVDGAPASTVGWWVDGPSRDLERADRARRRVRVPGLPAPRRRLRAILRDAAPPPRARPGHAQGDGQRELGPRGLDPRPGRGDGVADGRADAWRRVGSRSISEPCRRWPWCAGCLGSTRSRRPGWSSTPRWTGPRGAGSSTRRPLMSPLYWSAGRPMGRVRSGRVELRFPPTRARYLRSHPDRLPHALALDRLGALRYALDASAPPQPAPWQSGADIAGALRAAGVRRLYADHGWGSAAALADPELRILPANLHLDPYGWDGPGRSSCPRSSGSRGPARSSSPSTPRDSRASSRPSAVRSCSSPSAAWC